VTVSTERLGRSLAADKQPTDVLAPGVRPLHDEAMPVSDAIYIDMIATLAHSLFIVTESAVTGLAKARSNTSPIFSAER
jgi:hypothetical protein